MAWVSFHWAYPFKAQAGSRPTQAHGWDQPFLFTYHNPNFALFFAANSKCIYE